MCTGEDDASEAKTSLENMTAEAIGNGLPQELHGELQELIIGHSDIFRIKMG